MPTSAQRPRGRLLSQLRTGFVNQPVATLSQLKSAASMIPTALIQATASITPNVAGETFFSTEDQLQTLEKVMDEVVAAKSQSLPPIEPSPSLPTAPTQSDQLLAAPLASVIPQAVDQTVNIAQQQQAASTAFPTKEVLRTPIPEAPVSADAAMIEATANTATAAESLDVNNPVEAAISPQYQEVGPVSPEISPEIASYLQEVTSHNEQLPQEIVVNNNDVQFQAPIQPLRPVIVLPITPELEAVGAKKKTNWSLRWLVEWSRRLMRIFAGKVIYQNADKT